MATYTAHEALDHIRAMATRSVPNCINLDTIDRILADTLATPASLTDVSEQLTPKMLGAMQKLDKEWADQLHATQQENARLVQETHKWSEAVKKLEAERDRFQIRVGVWMQKTFGPEVSADFTGRGFRFGEEALELLQANGTSKEDVLKLVDYVYSRPVGELPQEVGGTMVTLAALCEARGINLAALANDEQTRVEQPAVRAKIQQKQEAKRVRMIATPLPGILPAS